MKFPLNLKESSLSILQDSANLALLDINLTHLLYRLS